MVEHPWSETYESAIEALTPYVHKDGAGLFYVDMEGVDHLDISPAILADLLRSLNVTNDLVAQGDIKPEEVNGVTYPRFEHEH